MPRIHRIATIILSLAGMAVMAYLTAVHYAESGSAFCDLSQELSCSFVNQSRYADVAGIPIAVLGIITFAVLGLLAMQGNARIILLVVLASLLPSLYLSGIEFFVLKSICVFCEIAKALFIIILAVALHALRTTRTALPWKHIVLAVLLGMIGTAITAVLQRPTSPPQDYSAFAQCLADKGFIMYGSVTCGACAKQRAMFGDAFRFIEEIECDPRNPNPETERCIAKNIQKTPTWIQEETNGNERYRFAPGLQALKDLSDVAGCPLNEEL